MLIFTLKTLSLLLLLLLMPVICHAENDDAPAKFYDGLPIAVEKKVHHTAKENTDDSDIDEKQEWDLEQITTTYRKHRSRQNKALENPDLHLSSETQINAFDRYVVGKNENLSSIALRFKVSVAQLAAWNAITSPNQLYQGKKLKIFKNKQKHSDLKATKKQSETAKILRDNSQKTSIISINNKSMLKFYCHWSTKGKIIKTFSQTGGRGIEINGRAGQAIKATAAGKVVAVSSGIYGHGGFIVIRHQGLILSSYANNSRALVKNGQAVTEGQKIAEMGSVGKKPPSLEFEIRKNGALVNPLYCLPPKK